MSAPQPPRYQVTAPMVVAKSSTPQGTRLQNFYRHALLPPDVPEQQIELFMRRRLIVQIDENGLPIPPAPADAPTDAPAGTAAGAKTGGRTAKNAG